MRVNEGWRALPYLADGSAGIGLVLRRYLAHREDEAFRAVLEPIRRASTSRFHAQAGLFNGRAGLLLALADADACSTAQGAGESDEASDGLGGEAIDQMRRLAWHAVGHRGALAFPGDQLHRLSTDLATGGAGVLLALGAVLGEPRAHLPFFPGGPPAAR